MNRIIKIILQDILKNKIVLGYTLILAILSWSSFALEDNSAKGLLTILNVILFTVPLVSILFSTIYLYNSSEFIELLLSQPVKRQKIWLSLFIGLSFFHGFLFPFGSRNTIISQLAGQCRIHDDCCRLFGFGSFCRSCLSEFDSHPRQGKRHRNCHYDLAVFCLIV